MVDPGHEPRDPVLCLWYDGPAEEAARFSAQTVPDSQVLSVQRAPSDYPSGRAAYVLVVQFRVFELPWIGLTGGPAFRPNEAFLFQVATVDQQETDRYWSAIADNGGLASACGWRKGRWGCRGRSRRAFDAMVRMGKFGIAAIGAAIRR